MSARQLIVNADDFGLTEGHNRAIVHAHAHGIVTSASLMACGCAFGDAARGLQAQPRLGAGVHLTLVEGKPVQRPDAIPLLVRGDRFGSVHALLWHLTARPAALCRQVCAEWRAQIERVLAAGVVVTHLDSHKHLHLHPQLLGIALLLAQEYGICRMRLACPASPIAQPKPVLLGLLSIWARRRLARCGVRAPDALLGVGCSGQMTVERLLNALHIEWHGVRELMVHPAYHTPSLSALARRGYRWIDRYCFEEEVDALCSPQVRATLGAQNISLVSYAVI